MPKYRLPPRLLLPWFVAFGIAILLVTLPSTAGHSSSFPQGKKGGKPGPPWVKGVQFSPDGKTLATLTDYSILQLWEVATGKSVATVGGMGLRLRAMAFSPDSKTIVASASDQTVRFIDTATGKEIASAKDASRGQPRVHFSPDGKTLLVGNLWSWQLLEAATRKELPSPRGNRLAVFSPDSKKLALWGNREWIDVWDLTAGKLKATVDLPTARSADDGVIVSPDSQKLIIASPEGSVSVVEIETGKVQRVLEKAGAPQRLSPDGKTLVTVDNKGGLMLWDFASGNKTDTLKGSTAGFAHVAFSPDGQHVVSASHDFDSEITKWTTATGKKVSTFSAPGGAWTHSLSISPDAKTVAFGLHEERIEIREVDTGNLVRAWKVGSFK